MSEPAPDCVKPKAEFDRAFMIAVANQTQSTYDEVIKALRKLDAAGCGNMVDEYQVRQFEKWHAPPTQQKPHYNLQRMNLTSPSQTSSLGVGGRRRKGSKKLRKYRKTKSRKSKKTKSRKSKKTKSRRH